MSLYDEINILLEKDLIGEALEVLYNLRGKEYEKWERLIIRERARFHQVLLGARRKPNTSISPVELRLFTNRVRRIAKEINEKYPNISAINKQSGILFSKERLEILIFEANPIESSRMRVNAEIKLIKSKISNARYEKRIDFRSSLSTTIEDLQSKLLKFNYGIVHFSGHGKKEGLVLEDKDGTAFVIDKYSFIKLIEVFSKKIHCLILGTCYSLDIAKSLSKDIQYIIATSGKLDDSVANKFSGGFYQAIGEGESIENAYKLGILTAKAQNKTVQRLPKLIKYKPSTEDN